MNLLEKLFPNAINLGGDLWQASLETLYMTFWTCLIAFFIGLVLGLCLVLTMPGGLKENKMIYNVLDQVVNILRAIPFVILMALLVNVTRGIVGTSIGTTATIVPLVFATVPFYARQVQHALVEVNSGVIEAAQSMGLSTWEIIYRVYLREGLIGIIRASALSIISVIGLTAMAGTIGGGGLGNLAIVRGYNRLQDDVTIVTVVIILIIVFISQFIANRIIKRLKH